MFAFFYSIFGWLFRILYSFISNYGLALLIFTVFFRIVVLPLNIRTQKSSAKSVRMQPKLKRIREKYADYSPQERQQRIQQETNELYQREGYSAMTQSCTPLLIQLPILWGLYGVVRQPLTYVLKISDSLVSKLSDAALATGLASNSAYTETAVITHLDQLLLKMPSTAANYAADIQKIRDFNFTVFGVELGQIPTFSTLKNFSSASSSAKILLLIPLLAFVTSLMTSVLTQVRQKHTNPNMENQMRMQMGCMMFMMPAMSLWFTFQFPAGLGMYWILSNIIAFFQTLILGSIYAPRKVIARMMVDETINARAYEKQQKLIFDKNS